MPQYGGPERLYYRRRATAQRGPVSVTISKRRKKPAKKGTERAYRSLKAKAQNQGDQYPFIRFAEEVLDWSYGDAGAGLAVYGYALTVALSELINVSEFTSLYDFYMIDKCIFHFLPSWADAEIEPKGAEITAPWLFYWQDLDDDTVPTSLTTAYQRQNLKFRVFKSQFKVSVTVAPKTAVLLSDAVPTVSRASNLNKSSRAWLDMANTNIEHYGLHVILDQSAMKTITGETAGPQIKVVKEVHFRARGVR